MTSDATIQIPAWSVPYLAWLAYMAWGVFLAGVAGAGNSPIAQVNKALGVLWLLGGVVFALWRVNERFGIVGIE